MLCIGHRGAMGYRPENTLASFSLALEMGCPWVELDVYCVGREILVIHDDRLDRTTNGKGRLANQSLPYLRGLDAGSGQQIPLLAEVVDLINRRGGINVELKGSGTAGPVCELLEQYVANGWDRDQFLISSFDHDELARTDARFRRGALFGRRSRGNLVAKAKRLDAWSINLDLARANQAIVDDAHENGLVVLVYTVNEADDIRRMRDLGVDGVFTNYPDRVIDG
jgi:glycerophosphoryl diester phosphodiesterase